MTFFGVKFFLSDAINQKRLFVKRAEKTMTQTSASFNQTLFFSFIHKIKYRKSTLRHHFVIISVFKHQHTEQSSAKQQESEIKMKNAEVEKEGKQEHTKSINYDCRCILRWIKVEENWSMALACCLVVAIWSSFQRPHNIK